MNTIPTVTDNQTESINISIIAIKRAIQELNERLENIENAGKELENEN